MIVRSGTGIALALVILLSGCAELRLLGSRADESAATAFEMQGRVFVRYDQRAFSGALRWVHAIEADEIWFSGPLGQTAAYLQRDHAGATLTTADQQVYRSFSLEALTERGLGWTFPVTDMSHYVLGEVPPRAAGVIERDAAGRPVRVEHDGWSVQWTPTGASDETERPRRLQMRRGEVEIRLVIDRLDRRP